jgi:invasion protein IalB
LLLLASRLSPPRPLRYVSRMKILPALALATLLPAAALAADSSAPTSLGTFGDWTAATYGAGAKKACYAFTKAQGSSETIPSRGDVLLVVTERKSGHDEVTLSAGYTYPAKPTVTLDVGGPKIDFYTQGATAFTTSGAAAITAFQQGSSATAKSSAPGGAMVTDTFSLAGFSDAYSAITTACP